LIVLSATQLTSALTIKFVEDPGALPTSEQRQALAKAKESWEAFLTDPIQVEIRVRFRAIDPSREIALATTESSYTTHSWDAVRICLQSDSNGGTATEQAVMAQLQSVNNDGGLPGLLVQDFRIRGQGDLAGPDLRVDDRVTMTTANAKALMLGTGSAAEILGRSDLDANISFNTHYTFDYNRADGIAPLSYDFISVAQHEIGHVLGFSTITGWQDANQFVRLHPMPLDIWRFSDSNRPHAIGSDVRYITKGAAEYYDTTPLLNNADFGWGNAPDPLCPLAGNLCQAGHWRGNWSDTKPRLMDGEGLDAGVVNDLTIEDVHALDYIGYDWTGEVPGQLNAVRFSLSGGFKGRWVDNTAPRFAGLVENMPRGPLERSSFDANTGMELEFDLGEGPLAARSALGLLRFEAEQRYEGLQLVSPEIASGDIDTQILPEHPDLIPARLTHFVFATNDGLPAIRFVDSFADSGATFDPSLGPFGGFQIAGFLDGELDDVADDGDGAVFFKLLADRPLEFRVGAQNTFSVEYDEFDTIALYDQRAFGVPEPALRTVSMVLWGLVGLARPRRR
jgi:hypothetical protein